MLKSMACPYDDFAWFYDRYWNEEFHSLAFPILEQIWLPRVPARRAHPGRLLGHRLPGRTCSRRAASRVTGIDSSPEMVALRPPRTCPPPSSRSPTPAISMPGPFDAAVSTFDSLNHILELRGLKAAFRTHRRALQTGAPFAFDMLLEEAYQTHWGENFAIVRDDHVLTITGSGFDFRSRRWRSAPSRCSA